MFTKNNAGVNKINKYHAQVEYSTLSEYKTKLASILTCDI